MLPDTALRVGLPAALRPRSTADRLTDAPATPAERRRSGRTRRMILSLPADGAVVIVHSPSVVGIVRDLIRELRGDEVAALARVVAAPTIADERAVTARLSLPVVRDHFVDEQREHARALMQAWRL